MRNFPSVSLTATWSPEVIVAPETGAPVCLSTTEPSLSAPHAQADAESSRKRDRREHRPARRDKEVELPMTWPLQPRSIFRDLLHIDGPCQESGEGRAPVVIA